MKIIAFKRSNNPHQHPLYITEFIDASLLSSLDGYESMIEEHFNLELAKNPERHDSHLKYLKEQELLAKKASESSVLVSAAEEKEDLREYKRFKAWQRHNGNK